VDLEDLEAAVAGPLSKLTIPSTFEVKHGKVQFCCVIVCHSWQQTLKWC